MAQVEFTGYAVTDTKKWSDFEVVKYPSKNWEETDVEIAITHCGVCGSDVHTITGGWGDIDTPLVVGHEIVGVAKRVGSQVKGIKVGDRVGVGAQISSCYTCKLCKTDNENYCPEQIDTYGAKYKDGVKTMGGYSTGIIANELFVFPIPEAIASEDACSMLCAGLTVYSPLLRNGAGPGKKVGIIGIGGLGHYAVLFAKALGAEVYAFTSSNHKVDDIKKLGADHVVVASGEDFAKPLAFELDLIVSTRDVAEGFPLQEYMSTLKVHGRFVTVGLPDEPLPGLKAFAFLTNGCFLGGSHIGSKAEALQMLDLAAKKGIKPWIEVLPMKDAKKAVEGVKNNKVKYRYVLKQDLV